MTVQALLSPDRCIILEREQKQEAIAELVGALWRSQPHLDYARIFDAIWDREVQLTTRISEQIAMPHAQVAGLDGTYVCVGHSLGGITYDSKDQGLVRLVFLVVGPPEQHLKVLSTLARYLMKESNLERLLAAKSGEELYHAMTEPEEEADPTQPETGRTEIPDPRPEPAVKESSPRHEKKTVPDLEPYQEIRSSTLPSQNRVMWEAASRLALQLKASVVFIHGAQRQEVLGWYQHARILEYRDLRDYSPEQLASPDSGIFPDLVLVEGSTGLDPDAETQIAPHVRSLAFPYLRSRANPVPLAILMGLSRGIIRKGQRVVSVYGKNDSELHSIEISDIDRDFGLFFSMPFHGSSADTQMEVFMRTLQLATELASEGREGKAVGTVLVIGDAEQVARHSQQLVVNPFRGYEDHERNILDPSLTETLKEFSRIDGAIVIRGDGVIVSAGTFIRVDRPVEQLPSGLGARHTAAAGITAVTRAVSISISESTRQISIFYAGNRVMVI